MNDPPTTTGRRSEKGKKSTCHLSVKNNNSMGSHQCVLADPQDSKDVCEVGRRFMGASEAWGKIFFQVELAGEKRMQ